MWDKIKNFFKKNWKSICFFFSGIAVGIISYFSIDRERNRRIKQYIEYLSNRITEYEQLNTRLDNINKQLEEQLNTVGRSTEQLATTVFLGRKLAEVSTNELSKSRANIDIIAKSIDSIRNDTDKLDDIATKLQKQSGNIELGISRLKEFIRINGKATNIHENSND